MKDKFKKLCDKLKTKLFWCELMIILGTILFITTTFLLNFWIGMYLLSVILCLLGYLIYKM